MCVEWKQKMYGVELQSLCASRVSWNGLLTNADLHMCKSEAAFHGRKVRMHSSYGLLQNS